VTWASASVSVGETVALTWKGAPAGGADGITTTALSGESDTKTSPVTLLNEMPVGSSPTGTVLSTLNMFASTTATAFDRVSVTRTRSIVETYVIHPGR